MKRGVRSLRGWAGAALLVCLLGALAGCFLFNLPPVARMTVTPEFGRSPLAVTFDALNAEEEERSSFDPDGEIVSYLWDFGDGDTDTGETVTHVFVTTTEARVFTVTLTVVDDRGARGEISQSIEVLAGGGEEAEGEGVPVARFTADPRIGVIPLTVTFDASDSTGGEGSIIEYDWDFGDGDTAMGTPVTHTFEPAETDEFSVTLFVWNSEGEFDTEQVEIVAIVPGDVTGDEPLAELVISDPDMIYESEERPNIPSLFEVAFDPRGSSADAGHEIEYFLWEFGDGAFRVEESDLEVTHIYELRTLSRTYVARLTVFDDQGLEGTATVNITVTDEFGEDEEED